jgi:hypothetical protein
MATSIGVFMQNREIKYKKPHLGTAVGGRPTSREIKTDSPPRCCRVLRQTGAPRGGASNLYGNRRALTARGSRAHFFSVGGGLNIKSEIREIKRADKVEHLQDVGPEGLVGHRFQLRVSTIYFQSVFLLPADARHGEGGLNPRCHSGPGPHGKDAHFSAKFGKLFLQGHLAGTSHGAVMRGATFKKRRVIQGGGGGHGMVE